MKNKLHSLTFPKKETDVQEKKVVDYLYIDADENHVALQFREKKGDVTENEYHQKNNRAIVCPSDSYSNFTLSFGTQYLDKKG